MIRQESKLTTGIIAECDAIGVVASDHWLTSIYRATTKLGLNLNEFKSLTEAESDILVFEVTIDSLDEVIFKLQKRRGNHTFVVGDRDCQSLQMLLLEAGATACFFSIRQMPQLGQLLYQLSK